MTGLWQAPQVTNCAHDLPRSPGYSETLPSALRPIPRQVLVEILLWHIVFQIRCIRFYGHQYFYIFGTNTLAQIVNPAPHPPSSRRVPEVTCAPSSAAPKGGKHRQAHLFFVGLRPPSPLLAPPRVDRESFATHECFALAC